MKRIQKFLALVLVLALTLSLSVTAFATDSYTITIKPKENTNDKADHSYQAYQLFKGDLTEEKDNDGKVIKRTLSNITWGDNVDSSKLGELAAAINALRNSDAEGYEALTAESSAAKFAEALEELNAGHDDATAQAVADAFGAVLTGSPKGTGTATLSDENTENDNASIQVDEAGYYLVMDQANSLNGEENAAYTRYILQVVSDVTVEAKNEVPSIDKKIQNGEDLVNAATASIGDEIPFVLTTAVPDMTGYDKYYFIVNDTLCEGLTFNADSVAITVNGQPLDSSKYTVVETPITEGENAGKTAVKIVFKDFYNEFKDVAAGTPIVISYNATLNEDADLTATGNDNEVTLTYSNDPNFQYDGTPGHDEPGDNEPIGVTPKSITKTFTTGIKLTKVDAEDASNTLTGAKFKIEGTKVNVTLINSQVFHKVADDSEITSENEGNVYYRLKDGSYTKTAPTDETMDDYESDDKYLLIEEVTKTVDSEDVEAEAWVDANGVITFVGLGAGDYTITELVAPEGYNLLTAPINVHIGATLDDTAMTCTWEPTLGTGEAGEDALSIVDNLIQLQVKNSQGPELPTTGGIGTTLFYVIGALLVLSAGVLLVVRKRAAAQQ